MLRAFGIAWLGDCSDPHTFIFTNYQSKTRYGIYYGENYIKFARSPRQEFDVKSLNKIIEEAAETNLQKRENIYIEIQNLVSQHAVNVPLYQPYRKRVHRSWLKG